AGSASVDLATSTTVTLLDSTVHLLPTGTFGPLGGDHSALLLGRSSVTLSGLFALPRVIDSDFKGEIQIIAGTPFPPCTVPQGASIAQLLFFATTAAPSPGPFRGEAGFGSTGVPQIWWTQQISEKRPTCQCMLLYQGQRVVLMGIVDTGADVTVIS
ncbi:POK9 protein, partial [Pardalotus punctatus]|nr:POK9 protein [Pardalotus punctatus]